MPDREQTALQEKGEAYYLWPTLSDLVDDCAALGINPRKVTLKGINAVGGVGVLAIVSCGRHPGAES